MAELDAFPLFSDEIYAECTAVLTESGDGAQGCSGFKTYTSMQTGQFGVLPTR